MFFNTFMIVPLLMFVLVAGFAVFMMIGMFTGRTQQRMMKNTIRTLKSVTDEMAPDMKNMVGGLTEMKKEIFEEHGDTIRDLAAMDAELEAMKTRAKAQAVKDVFGSDSTSASQMFSTGEKKSNKVVCQNCGTLIDADSMYCKVCGKRPF